MRDGWTWMMESLAQRGLKVEVVLSGWLNFSLTCFSMRLTEIDFFPAKHFALTRPNLARSDWRRQYPPAQRRRPWKRPISGSLPSPNRATQRQM